MTPAPTQITLSAVLTLPPAFQPSAMLLLPVVLPGSDAPPMAVLRTPVVLPERASNPNALFLVPVVLFVSVPVPHAVLFALSGPNGPRCADAVRVALARPAKQWLRRFRAFR